MGLFSLDYQDIPGQCVYAKGGLKFRGDEARLRRYFAQVLPYVSLRDLIGEAVFWFLLPSTAAVWAFAFLLYARSILFAVVITALLYLAVYIIHMLTYLKPINYGVFVLANWLLQLAAYLVLAIILAIAGSIAKTVALGGCFLFFRLGIDRLALFPLIPIFAKLFSSAPSDQILKNVGRRYARKYIIP